MMPDPTHPIAQLLQQDKRYRLEAYIFVFEALNYAQSVLGMGGGGGKPARDRGADEMEAEAEAAAPEEEQHLTGGQLCEAIRLYALEQYGYMAKTVFASWGVHSTSDFGEIVFNLIGIEQMRKTPQDRKEDFDDVFDFDTDLQHAFKITLSE